MKNLIRKINIVIKKITRAFKSWFDELQEEFHVILRNRNYGKTHPNLFAIFSIIEQEQNTQIFELQKRNFKKIKGQILKDVNITDREILESLRGIFHNNKVLPEQSEAKAKISNFLFNKSSDIITQNEPYYTPLAKVILFAFPFLLNHKNYEILRKLIKRKSSNSLKLLKDIFDNHQSLEFLINKEDITELVLASISFDNKPAFMILVKFLRKNDQIPLILKQKDFIEKSKILNPSSSATRGFDYIAVFLAYFEDELFDRSSKAKIKTFLEEIFSDAIKPKEKAKRYNKIMSYIILGQKIGYKNFIIESLVKNHIGDCEFGKVKTRSQISRIKKLQKSFFKIKLKPRADVKIRSITNLTNQHPEEYWLMQFSPYLI